MITYWQRFAKTGNLVPEQLPRIAAYSTDRTTELAFTSRGSRAVTDEAAAHQCSFWAGLS